MEPMNIETIKNFCRNKKLRWTNHIFIRLTQRGITIDNIVASLLNGEIIENYPDDYPYPSCLVLGYTSDNSPVHTVCGSNGEELWLITAYYPDKTVWSSDYKTRKEILK